jgi:hypothetical protein
MNLLLAEMDEWPGEFLLALLSKRLRLCDVPGQKIKFNSDRPWTIVKETRVERLKSEPKPLPAAFDVPLGTMIFLGTMNF